MAKASFKSTDFSAICSAIREKGVFTSTEGTKFDFSHSILILDEITIDGQPISAENVDKLVDAINANDGITEVLFAKSYVNSTAMIRLAQGLAKNSRIINVGMPDNLETEAILKEREKLYKDNGELGKQIDTLLKKSEKTHPIDDMNKGITKNSSVLDLIKIHRESIDLYNNNEKELKKLDNKSIFSRLFDDFLSLFRSKKANKEINQKNVEKKTLLSSSMTFSKDRAKYLDLLILRKGNEERLESLRQREANVNSNVEKMKSQIEVNANEAIKKLRAAAISVDRTNKKAQAQTPAQTKQATIIAPPVVTPINTSTTKPDSTKLPEKAKVPLATATTVTNTLASAAKKSAEPAQIRPLSTEKPSAKKPVAISDLTQDTRFEQYMHDIQARKAKNKSVEVKDLKEELKKAEEDKIKHMAKLEGTTKFLEVQLGKAHTEIHAANERLAEILEIQKQIEAVNVQMKDLRKQEPFRIDFSKSANEKRTKIKEQLAPLEAQLNALEKSKAGLKSEGELRQVLLNKRSEFDELRRTIEDRQEGDFEAFKRQLNIHKDWGIDYGSDVNSHKEVNRLDIDIDKLKNMVSQRSKEEERELEFQRNRGPATALQAPEQGLSAYITKHFKHATSGFPSSSLPPKEPDTTHATPVVFSQNPNKPSMQLEKIRRELSNRDNAEPSPFDLTEVDEDSTDTEKPPTKPS